MKKILVIAAALFLTGCASMPTINGVDTSRQRHTLIVASSIALGAVVVTQIKMHDKKKSGEHGCTTYTYSGQPYTSCH